MLQKEYSTWIKQDHEIPGLATLLNPEVFQKRLQPIVPVEKVSLKKLWYEPETYCIVAYQTELYGAPADVYAKAHRPNKSNKLRQTPRSTFSTPVASPQKVILEKDCIAVLFFPADDQLASLTHLMEPEKRAVLLKELFPDQADFWTGSLHPLQYKPERRYVVRLDTQKGQRAVLKFCRPQVFSESLTAARAFNSQGILRIPQCLGFSKTQNCLAFEWLPGQPLKKILHRDLQSAIPVVKSSGAALAKLHDQKVAGLACQEESSSIESVTVEVGKLSLFSPALKATIERLGNAISTRLAEQSPVRHPIHGSFHLSQVLVDGNKLGFIDFDNSVFGDPRQDLGRFIASLHQSAIRGKIPENYLDFLTQAFLSGYCQNSGKSIPSGLEAYVAMALFKLPNLHPSSSRAGESDYSKLIHTTLGRVEMVLKKPFSGQLERIASPPSFRGGQRKLTVLMEDPYRIDKDPKLLFLKDALNPSAIQHRLESRLRDSGQADVMTQLNAIRVTRHKPGRRCLIEYDIVAEQPEASPESLTLMGKVHARGLDEVAYRLQTSLFEKGFGLDSNDKISIPMPVGVLPEFNMWLYRKVPGIPSSQRILQPGWEEVIKRIAEGIHKVHHCDVKTQRRHTMDDELRILNERLPLLIPEKPQWKHRIARILDACARLGGQVPATLPTGIHRDFYPDQVLVDNARIYIIDFDLFSLGDPGLDAGNFIGHLTEQALRELGDAEALADRQSIFKGHFLRLAGSHYQRSVRAYEILTLVRHIYISSLFSERKAFTEPILELCEKRLDLA